MHRSPILLANTLSDALAGIELAAGEVVVLPSSLDARDRLAVQMADALNLRADVEASVMEPPALGVRLRSLIGGGQASGWRTVDVRAIDPSCQLVRVVLPARLVEADGVVVVCDLDRVEELGPYILDVAAAYVGASTVLRVHASRERIAAVAEIDLALRMRGAIIALTLGGERWFIATADPIAGELVALALSEQARGVGRSVVGPWEDPVVQRATELRLGVLLPAALELAMTDGASSSSAGMSIAKHLELRLGML